VIALIFSDTSLQGIMVFTLVIHGLPWYVYVTNLYFTEKH